MALTLDKTADVYSNIVNNNSRSVTFSLPKNVELDVESVVATITNSSTAICKPTMTISDSSGQVIAAIRQGVGIPAADSGNATWALRLGGDSESTIFTQGLFFETELTGTAVSIDTTGTDISGGNVLEVWAYARSDAGGFGVVNLNFTFNGDTNNVYDSTWVRNQSGAVAVNDLLSQANIPSQMPGPLSTPSGIFGITRMTVPFYNDSIFHTIEFSCGWKDNAGVAADRAILGASQWRNATPITSVQVTANAGNLVAGTRLMILGR